MIALKNWTLNATAAAAARKKFDGGVTGQSTTSTAWKFDSVSRRNLTAPGSIPSLTHFLGRATSHPVCTVWPTPSNSTAQCPLFVGIGR